MTFNDCKALSGEGTDIVAACMQAEAAIRATLMQVDAAQKAADAQALAAFSAGWITGGATLLAGLAALGAALLAYMAAVKAADRQVKHTEHLHEQEVETFGRLVYKELEWIKGFASHMGRKLPNLNPTSDQVEEYFVVDLPRILASSTWTEFAKLGADETFEIYRSIDNYDYIKTAASLFHAQCEAFLAGGEAKIPAKVLKESKHSCLVKVTNGIKQFDKTLEMLERYKPRPDLQHTADKPPPWSAP